MRLTVITALLLSTMIVVVGVVSIFGVPLGAQPPSEETANGFGNVNLFSGTFNLEIPLFSVGGRGDAAIPIMLRFNEETWRKWMYFQMRPGFPNPSFQVNCGVLQAHSLFPTIECSQPLPPDPLMKWVQPQRVAGVGMRGYGPGKLVGRTAIKKSSACYECTQGGQYCTLARTTPTTTRMTLTYYGPDGAHELIDRATLGAFRDHGYSTNGNCSNPPPHDTWSRGRVFISNDGSGITFVSDTEFTVSDPITTNEYGEVTAIGTAGMLYLPNGSWHRIDASQVSWIKDRNGNTTTFSYSGGKLHTITDSMGRIVTIEYNVQDIQPYGLSDRISYKGFGGADRTIRVSKTNLESVLKPGNTIKTNGQLFPAICYGQQAGSCATEIINPIVTSALWLSDGRSYKFEYTSFAEVARIETPSGGAVEFDHDYAEQNVTDFEIYSLSRLVKEKRIYVDADNPGSLESKTKYSRSPASGNWPVVVTVQQTDAQDNILAKTVSYFHGDPEIGQLWPIYDIAPWYNGLEFKTDHFASDGVTLLRRVSNTWANRVFPAQEQWTSFPPFGPLDPRLLETTTLLADTNQVSKKIFAYDDFNNVTDTYEYDFGTGAPGGFLRRTHTDYVTDTNYTSHTGAHLRGLPLQTWVSSDIYGNNKASLTQTEYDNYNTDANHAALVSRSNVVGHDTANYGASNTLRGNVTKVTSYGNAQTQTEPVSAYSQYDILGNVVKTIDAKGNASTISYDDNFGSPDGEARTNTPPSQLNGQNTFTFATSATNPLGWTTYNQFDYCLSEEVDAEDANGVVDSTFYDDPLDRATKEIQANNLPNFRRQERTIYDDANRRIESRSDLFTFGDDLSKSESYYDGLGRTTESHNHESDGGYVAVKTEYDSLGRLKRATNPYRPLSNEQPKWKITRYDALSRVTETETPDGGIMKTSFSGNETTVTDQALRSRKSQTDALGRLKKIFEDPVLPNDQNPQNRLTYETSYGYNVLGNLITVTQGEQTRTFTYDSLSRLKTATNPESGTVALTYDPNNNLLTKTDARGINVTHTYDALNRPLTKNYSDGTTPNATYTYEDTNIPNSRGKLTKLETSASTNRYTSFDVLGRTLSSRQETAGQTYDFAYSYDLSGNLKSETYPSTRVTTFEYDNDGDLAKVFGRPNQNTIDRTYASNFVYTPHGKVQSLRLGNGKFESTQFNSTLQPVQIGLGSSTTNAGLWKLNYDYGTTDNNGNVKSQTVTVPTIVQNQGFTAVQNYAYDALNRLRQADEKPQNYTQNDCTQNPAKCWKQTFAYDRYGNRRFDLNQTTLPNPAANPAKVINPSISTQNNRFVVDQDGDGIDDYKYDLSGNLTQDAELRKFSYNGENKQTEVKDANNQVTATYEYDGDGNRVKKTIPGTGETTIFVYDADGDLSAEYTLNAPPTPNPTTNYLTADALGSPRVITDNFGNVVARRDFMPFGEDINSGIGNRTTGLKYDSDNITQRFTRKERDKETGLDYFEARYYSSKWGRFTSSDEFVGGPEELIEFDGMLGHNPTFYAELAEPQSLNKYQYCLNNPLRYVDPDGHQSTVADAFFRYVAPALPAILAPAAPAIVPVVIVLVAAAAVEALPVGENNGKAREMLTNRLGPPLARARPKTQPQAQPQAQPQTAPETTPTQRPDRPNQTPKPKIAPPSPDLGKRARKSGRAVPTTQPKSPAPAPTPGTGHRKPRPSTHDPHTKPRSGDKQPPDFGKDRPKRPQDMPPKPPKPPKKKDEQ